MAENIYGDAFSLDPYEAGRMLREQGQNLQGFGRGVAQVGRGVAAAPGQVLEGVRGASSPYLDQQFAAMEQQGRNFRQGVSDFRLGLSGGPRDQLSTSASASTPPPAPLPDNIARAQDVRNQVDQKYLSPTPGGDDIKGAAARINPNPRAFPQRQLEQQLVQDSQQRTAPAQAYSQPWGDAPMGSTQHALYQLGVLRQLNDMPQQGAGLSMAGLTGSDVPDYVRENAEKTRRWDAEERARQFKNALVGMKHTRAGALASFMNAQLAADTQYRGQDLASQQARQRDIMHLLGIQQQGQNQLAGYGMQGQNAREIEAMRGRNQLTGYEMQGQNAREIEAMRGRNQLAGYEMQGGNQRQQELLRQSDPVHQAYGRLQDASAQHQINMSDPMAQLNSTRKAVWAAQRDGSITQERADEILKAEEDRALREIWRRDRQKRENKANGGRVGFQEGGSVSRAQQLLQEMDAKHGKTASQVPDTQVPQTPQVPPAAQVPQERKGFVSTVREWMDPKSRMPVEARAQGGVVGYDVGGAVAPYNFAAHDGPGVIRETINGVDHITDPNAPGYAEFTGRAGLGNAGGYGSFTNSAGQKFGNIPGGAPIGQARGANADGLKTMTENQQARVMSGFNNRAYQAELNNPDSDIGRLERLTQVNHALEKGQRSDLGYGPMGPVDSGDNSSAGLQRRLDFMRGSGTQYATGGSIDVGGRQVLGAGTGKSDSLPARIDGKHPAALSTGEFVMPVETVRHFGLDKMHKMVAQSRKGLDTGRNHA